MLSYTTQVFAVGLFEQHRFGQKSSVLVVNESGDYLYSWNETKALIPASTVKIATSIAAIEKFGIDHRFHTDFFIHQDTLWVKGYGDPYLISEELDIIVENLIDVVSQRAISIRYIVADGSHFPVLKVPGRKTTNNPYDAPLAAISANFNTINVRKSGNKITSAEPQTPLTPLAKRLAKSLPNGNQRINLIDTVKAEQYFAELLAVKLEQKGLKIESSRTGVTPLDAKLIYRHLSSKSVKDAVHAMLFFSNNFIANQLFLQMKNADKAIGFDASADFVKTMLLEQLGSVKQQVKASIIEGSGLSRDNRLTAEQLVAMLARFKPYKKMMKSYLDGKAYAKSGSLNGVHNLAGYLSKDNQNYYFVFLFNEPVKWRFRQQLLQELYRSL